MCQIPGGGVLPVRPQPQGFPTLVQQVLDECPSDAMSTLGWPHGEFGARSLNRVGHVEVGVTRQTVLAKCQEMAPVLITTVIEVKKDVLRQR
jgi:hypothetical protein